jgi:hypothetical protein
MPALELSHLNKVERAVNEILRAFPVFRPVFEGTVPQGQFSFGKRLPKNDVDSLLRGLRYLRSEGLLDWQTGGFTQVVGGAGSGTFTDLAMNITETYRTGALGKVLLQ